MLTLSPGLVPVGDGEVFVDARGPESAPALVYVHGGPGQSCHDFMVSVGDLLADRLRVIGVDQRGVLRSGDLPADRPLTTDLLIDDFEAVRSALGIERWTVLGHSAGGGYALDYALARPESVSAAVFDCPCWDADLTDRHRLPVVARWLRELGKDEAAAQCEAFATKPTRLTPEDETRAVMQELGEDYLRLFLHDPASAEDYDRGWAAGGFSDEQRMRALCHLPLVEDMYRPRLDGLSRLTQPALLLHGVDDLVVPPEAIARFSERAGDAEGAGEIEGAGGEGAGRGVVRDVHTFERSAHFAFIEEPQEYARIVTAWALAHGPA